jgi:hypothetical protein
VSEAWDRYLPKDVCLWSRPHNGMFLWIYIAAEKHPKLQSRVESVCDKSDGEARVWSRACENGVQVTKGSLFRLRVKASNILRTHSVKPLGWKNSLAIKEKRSHLVLLLNFHFISSIRKIIALVTFLLTLILEKKSAI